MRGLHRANGKQPNGHFSLPESTKTFPLLHPIHNKTAGTLSASHSSDATHQHPGAEAYADTDTGKHSQTYGGSNDAPNTIHGRGLSTRTGLEPTAS